MILVIGGVYQGKLSFAKGLMAVGETGLLRKADCMAETAVADGSVDSYEKAMECPIINGFHQYVRRLVEEGKNWEDFLGEIKKKNPAAVIIACEVGSGIVPANAVDRAWREAAGRAAMAAASYSRDVYRVTCGIGVKIK